MAEAEQEKKMSEGRKQRAEQIAWLKELFQTVQGGVLTDFRGLNVAGMMELRRRFREEGVRYKVVKNTLTKIALEGTDYQDLQEIMSGPIAIAYTDGDPIVPARVAVDFAKDNQKLEVRGGFMEGSVLDENQIREVARIPGREELMAQFLSVVNGPSQKFLGVLNGVPQKFLGVLKARADEMEQG